MSSSSPSSSGTSADSNRIPANNPNPSTSRPARSAHNITTAKGIMRGTPNRWKRRFIAVVALLLLAPIPVFAIDFSTFSWQTTLTQTGGFFNSYSQSNTTNDSILTFTPNTYASTTPFNGSFTAYVSLLLPSPLTTTTDLNGTAKHLDVVSLNSTSAFLTVEIGSGTSVYTGVGPPPNNMFNQTTTNPAQPPSADQALTALPPGTYNTITVYFNGHGKISTASSPSSIVIDFHN